MEATPLAAENTGDAQALNVGSSEPVRVIEAAQMIARLAGYEPDYRFLLDMPTGPLNRVCDGTLAQRELGWRARTLFAAGVERTWTWYRASHSPESIARTLDRELLER